MISLDRSPLLAFNHDPEAVAAVEGWGLFGSGSQADGTARVEIRRNGPSSRFSSDEDARCFVVMQARNGSELHRSALNRMDRIEQNLVRLFCGDWQ